jgi:hypothetical protein
MADISDQMNVGPPCGASRLTSAIRSPHPESWPGLSRPSTSCLARDWRQGVDARDKRGHDVGGAGLKSLTMMGQYLLAHLSMPLRLLGEVRSLLQHVSRPMKLACIDPVAVVAKHETVAARQPRNRVQPVRRLQPPHLDTGHPRRHETDSHVRQFRLRAPSSLQGSKPRHRPGGDPARCPPSAVLEHSTRITGIIHQLSRAGDVPQGYSGVRSIQVTIG